MKCPKCDKECRVYWQEMKNGNYHIRQQCPSHGFIKFLPQTESNKTLADIDLNLLIEKQSTLGHH